MAGCAVALDELERHARELFGELERVGDRRARQQEARLGAVCARETPEPAQHVRHVRAEDAAVDVCLVDDDPGEIGEHVAPLPMVGQHSDVQHVRVGEHQVRPGADRPPLLARCVSVVDGVSQEARPQRGQAAGLVLRERLRRVEVQRAGAPVVRQRVEHRQVEGERLPARGPGGDDRVTPACGGVRLGLVRVELADASAGKRGRELGVQVRRQRRDARAPRPEAALRDELLAAAGLDQVAPRDRGARRRHAS